MENRIKIGDEWYVKESSINKTEDSIIIDPQENRISLDQALKGKFFLSLKFFH